MNIPTNQQKILDRSAAAARANRLLIGPGSLLTVPRADYQTNSAAVGAIATNTFWEAIFGTNLTTGTATYNSGGLVLTTNAGTNSLIRLVAGVFNGLNTMLVTGNGTRTSATITNVLKTAASGDIGNGIEFSWGIKTAADITASEIMCGLMSGDGTAGRISSTGPVAGAADAGYTGPDDGFYFFYNTSVGPNWYRCVNYGSTDEYVDTKIPVEASTVYELRALLHPSGKASFYINDTFVGRSTGAVDASTALVPCASIKAKENVAKTLTLAEPYIYVNR